MKKKGLNLKDFQEAQLKCAMQTASYLEKDLILYEHAFNLLLEMLERAACNKPPHSAVKTAVWIMMPRIVQSLQSIRDLTLSGHYYDVSVVRRSFIETIGLCAYLSQSSEEEAQNWCDGNDLNVAKISLLSYATRLVRNAKTMDDKRSKALYGMLCGYTHSNPRALIRSFHETDSSNLTMSASLAPEFDEMQVEYITHWALFSVAVLKEILHHELAESERNKIEELLNRYLLEMTYVYKTEKANTEQAF